ncbi:MAG: hypothetical protein ACFFA6_12715 [Promethearchaeota archaeon]
MSNFEWIKVNFQQFLNEFNIDLLVDNAPTILYSKKDKEPEAYNSLIAFFFITGGLLIYISLSYIFASFYFNIILIISISIVAICVDIFLIIVYLKSNVYIKPLECWVEIYRVKSQNGTNYYCFSYYPVFTGKCHPNVAKNVIYKFYQEEVLKTKINITQIEVYLKFSQNNQERIGYFFQYGQGRPFKDENIIRNSWKFFPSETSKNENFIAIANWDHQFEWRNDLELDFDKLHGYAPWVIQRWNDMNIKPLTEEFKGGMNWNLRNIVSDPKLKPWEGNLENQKYENPIAYKDINIVNEAIEKVIGIDIEIKKLKDVKDKLTMFKSYFRDLNF